MSFTDSADLSPERFLEQEAQSIRAQTIFDLDANPDDAARAFELSRATGAPPETTFQNLEEVDKQTKGALTLGIVDQNRFIKDYLASNPLAGKVSNDDVEQLDTISNTVQNFKRNDAGIWAKMGHRFAEVFNLEHQDEEVRKLRALLSETPGFENLFIREAAVAAGAGVQAGLMGLSAGAMALGKGMEELGIPRDFIAMTVENPFFAGGTGIRYAPVKKGLPIVHSAEDIVFIREAQIVKPWLDQGEMPPPGVSSVIDEVYQKQVEIDTKTLGEALKESIKSTTRERAPDLYANFVREVTDGEIGVSADAIQALYGDKVPALDDGILGWVPDLQTKLAQAEATGGDVRIPIADWLARIEPEVAKQLEGFVRFREGGVTLEEGAQGFEAFHGSPYEFEAFSSEKIGSGEGAQAYGYGHYFAENPEVAKSYQPAPYDKDGSQAGFGGMPSLGELHGETRQGNLYKARIKRSKEEFLDWDADMDAQPAGKKILAEMDPEFKNALEEYLDLHDQPELETLTGEMFHRLLERFASESEIPGVTASETGHYRREASEYIANLGVPGLKFLDKVSREAGEGTRNYVVFSDKDIEVVSRNGELIRNLRQATGLEPAVVPRLGLRQVGEATPEGRMAFEITDAGGEPIGHVAIGLEDGGKRIYIDDMGVTTGANTLGPKAVEELALQLKEMFPEAKTLEGMHVSGARERAGVTDPKAFKVKIDLTKLKRRAPDKIQLTEQEIVEGADTFGMTKEQYKLWVRALNQRLREDQDWLIKRAEKEARKRLMPEWKENESRIRGEVADELAQRRDLNADEYLRTGNLNGVPTGTILKINPELLTPEQLAAIPDRFVKKGGENPSDIATLLGYESVDALAADLRGIAEARGNQRPIEFRRQLVAEETTRRMEEQYGSLSEKILEEATERVLAESQIDMLHEQTMAAAMQAGLEFPLGKEQYRAALLDQFDGLRVAEAKSSRFIADAGRAARAMDIAALKGDFVEYFKQQQRQYNAIVFSKEALRLEKARAQFDKSVKKLGAPVVKAIDQGDLNYIHALLNDAGLGIKLTPDEIAANIEFQGHGTLQDYVNWRLSQGWEPAITDGILSGDIGSLKKGADNPMTVAQFRDFKDAIDSLEFIGREQKKIDIAGAKQDWDQFVQDVVDHTSALPPRSREGQMNPIWVLDAELTRMEEIIKDLDVRQELGPLYRAVIEPMMQAKATQYDLLSDLSAHFRAHKKQFGLKWRRTLNDNIPQDFLWDPYTLTLVDMSRENLIQIMLNWGNPSNRLKFSRGYATLDLRMKGERRKATIEEAAAFEARMKGLIDRHATKEDWDFVKMMWQPFKKFQPMMDTVSRNVSGRVPKWIKGDEVPTPFGPIEGGYWPVNYDKLTFDLERLQGRPHTANSTFGPDYFYPKVAEGNLKARTGYIDYVDIHQSIEHAAGVMQQSIQYIAFHEALTQASRVLHDRRIRATATKFYGKEYVNQFIPWLQRIANKNANDPATPGYNRAMRWLRRNLVGFALPLNVPVAMAVDVGKLRPGAWASYVANKRAWTNLAMEKSNEIRHLTYNLDRDFREQIENLWPASGMGGRYKGLKSEAAIAFERAQRGAVKWGLWPMMKATQQFRVATFVSEYYKGLERGLSDHEAAVVADAHVRERHGAASEVDLPSVMQSNEAMKNMTVFMTFLNSMRNGSRQLPGNIRRKEWGKFADNFMAYIMIPGLIGAAFFNSADEEESWPVIAAKGVAMMPLIGVPIVGQVTQYALGQSNPRDIYMAAAQSLARLWSEGERFVEGRPAKKPVRAVGDAIGALTGLPTLGPGRAGQFLIDYQARKQHPRNFFDWYRGIVYGDVKGRWK